MKPSMQHHEPTIVESVRLALFGLVVATASAVGQGGAMGPSVLTLLPYGNRHLAVDGRASGSLSNADYRSADDRHLQAWAFEGRAGQSVTFDLMSDDFDAYLFVIAPGTEDVLDDDDGGGGCQARVGLTLQQGGTVRVVVSSQSLRTTGTFTLSASSTPAPMRPGQCGTFSADVATFRTLPLKGTLALGQSATGALTSQDAVDDGGSYVQVWGLQGEANHSVSIDLVSDDFDAMLYLIGPGLSGALTDDDGGGACHSRITTTLPETGTYRVIASTLTPGVIGSFTLGVTSEPGPVSDEECVSPSAAELPPLDDLPLDGRMLRPGVDLEGRLTGDDVRHDDGSFVQAWGLEVVQGTAYTIDLRSDDFDAFLYAVGPNPRDIETDDDSGGGCHARITLQPSESGLVRVVVSSIGAGQTGVFRLRVSSVPGPVDPTPCRQLDR
jgi:hypothetical protein